jgi:hypothetical protein
VASGIKLEDEAQNGLRPLPYGIAEALGSLPSVALSSLAIGRIYHRYAVGIKR